MPDVVVGYGGRVLPGIAAESEAIEARQPAIGSNPQISVRRPHDGVNGLPRQSVPHLPRINHITALPALKPELSGYIIGSSLLRDRSENCKNPQREPKGRVVQDCATRGSCRSPPDREETERQRLVLNALNRGVSITLVNGTDGKRLHNGTEVSWLKHISLISIWQSAVFGGGARAGDATSECSKVITLQTNEKPIAWGNRPEIISLKRLRSVGLSADTWQH